MTAHYRMPDKPDWADQRAEELTGPCICGPYLKYDRAAPDCVFCQDQGETARALRDAWQAGYNEGFEVGSV